MFKPTKSLSCLTMLAAALTMAAPACASPVTLQAGETALLNIDLTAQRPSTTTDAVYDFTFNIDFASSFDVTSLVYTAFVDPNGSGFSTTPQVLPVSAIPPITFGLSGSGLVDALFSITITNLVGTLVFNPQIGVTFDTTRGDLVVGPVGLDAIVIAAPNQVPEPTSAALSLLALGLGIGLLPRRRAPALTAMPA